ncbi:uncharacterized protein [Amphiura filiformis]|uniref:uncharacterized protein isoform X2 n=1 Tax=Amphiura filiformis TaxID=82378 RepID=UPI003B224EBA
MKYIENFELREWVKDNLKKTIFQKAHALAVQTGCQIIVKLQDDLDVTQHQYYATDRLRKVFKNNGLRQRAGEKFVSGVTGEPLIDQAVQSDDTEHIGLQTSSGEVSDIDQIPSGIENRVESQGDDRVKPENGTSMCSEEPAIPVHMSMTCEMSEDTGMETSSQTDRHSAEETDDVYEGGGDAAPHVKIKEEPIDDDDPGGDGDDTTPMYQDQDLDSTTPTSQSGTQLLGASQFQGAATAPSTSQYLSTSSYQIPMSPKPYQCAMCGKAFRSVQVLQKHTHTFHMKTQHLMGARTSRGRGRGRQTGPRLMQLGANPTQPNSFTCIMCNISFPEVEILQDHMSRTHMGAASSGPPHTEGSPGNPNYSTPSTSQQATAFPSPSSDTPAAQGSPYSQQPGTSSSVPIFPMPLSSPSGSRASTSPGTARVEFPTNFMSDDHLLFTGATLQQEIQQSHQEKIWNLLDIEQRDSLGHVSSVRVKPGILETYNGHKMSGRGKIARVLVMDLFTVEERLMCNCRGGMGKPALDPVRMEAVRKAVFELLPCEVAEMNRAWNDCVKSIDASSRDLKRRKYFPK